MLLKIELTPEKKLVGKHIKMSLRQDRTKELWQSFMPGRKNIKNSMGQLLYSVEIYHARRFEQLDLASEFEKWAAVEVSGFEAIPDGMDSLILPGGLYAVFLHKGAASEGEKTYRYIFDTFLPNSGFLLDNRPHLGVMGEKYQNDSPDSEEEIWIPIQKKP